MPCKDKEKQKALVAAWYQRNKELTLKRAKKRRQQKRKEWWEFKAGLSCSFCGFSHPAAIDFHHPENAGETKVSEYARNNRWKKVYEEVEKCIPLCANCHRIHHYNERKGRSEDRPSSKPKGRS